MSLAAFASRTLPAAIVVGPEGGFTDGEVALARDCGVVAVHLGPRVLRAETAGVAALAMLAALAGDAR
jgi:16S rRNA (uracil1498-N3)-methyltransferase